MPRKRKGYRPGARKRKQYRPGGKPGASAGKAVSALRRRKRRRTKAVTRSKRNTANRKKR